MRALELLLEYNRDVTAKSVGNRLIFALMKDLSNFGNLDPGWNQISTNFDPAIEILHNKLGTLRNMEPDKLNAVVTLQKQTEMINAILSAIESKDPTPNKAYTPWLAKMYAKGNFKLEDINRGNLLGIHDLGKKRRMIKPEHTDINRFKSYKEFEDTMLAKYELDDIEASTKEADKGTAKKVYEDGKVTVIVPQDQAASCRYGRGTRWCTASTRGDNYFNGYNAQGPLYILIPKKPKHEGEKYQLHFPSDQFMDENDDNVNLYALLTERFDDPGLLNFFKKTNPDDLAEMIISMDDHELQLCIESIAELAKDHMWSIIGDMESDDSTYHDYLVDRGYVDEEGDIDWDKVHDGKDTYLDYNSDARGFQIDMEHAINPDPDFLKHSISRIGFESTTNISDLVSVISVLVRENFPPRREYDGGMADWLANNLAMQKKLNGDWVATTIKHKRR